MAGIVERDRHMDLLVRIHPECNHRRLPVCLEPRSGADRTLSSRQCWPTGSY